MFREKRSTPIKTDPNIGAGYFVIFVAVVIAGLALWSFTVDMLVPSLALARNLANNVFRGLPHGGLVDLGIDILWGAGSGFFVGWLRWQRRLRSKAVETIVEAVDAPKVVSATSLGWRYVLLHVGAGILAGIAVGLLGLAFPSQVTGSGTTVPAGIVWLRDAGLFGGGSGGGDGAAGGTPELLFIAILFLLFLVLPLLSGSLSAVAAIGLKGAASGAAGAAGKITGLALFLVLTRLRGKFWLPYPPVPEARPDPLPEPGPFDLDRTVKDFLEKEPCGRQRAVEKYKAWLKEQQIEFEAHAIGENAPRYKDSVIYELARHVNFELSRRDPGRKDHRLEYWLEHTAKERTFYEQRLVEELFGPGWLKRALLQGLAVGACTGSLTALLVAATLVILLIR